MMTLIKPVELTEAMITSNVPADDAPAWVSGTYASGAVVMHKNRLWEAVAAVSAGVEPGNETVTLENPAKWVDRGAINRWRMFDETISTTTVQEDLIEVEIQPGQATSALAALNLRGKTLKIQVEDPNEGLVYEKEESLADVGVEDWYEYFFAPFREKTDVVVRDLPSYSMATIKVSVEGGGEVAVGHLSIGKEEEIGVALYGTSVGIIDYSRKTVDEFGRTKIVKRPYSKRAEFDVEVDTRRVSRIQRLLASVRGEPVVWVGAPEIEATILYGFFKEFSINISGPHVSDATITVEGLI